ncbi:MAG: cytidylate kinase-like family protein [Lachnospiraceae bacterium]|nr:cytidylate kinase-like family protein [Lachnospiraceae bacterium]
MAEKYVVTISRQFGSLGRPIARKLSEILGIDYLDRDIVEETAKRMDLPVSKIDQEEEAVKSRFLGMVYPLGIGRPGLKDEIFNVQKNIIHDYAKKDSCIIVGRCAEYILANHPNVLKVYIYASYETRLKNCVESLGLEEKEAKEMMQEVDSARENYHKLYVAGYKTPFDYHDLCIDSGKFGVDGTAELIADIVRKNLCGAK